MFKYYIIKKDGKIEAEHTDILIIVNGILIYKLLYNINLKDYNIEIRYCTKIC